MRGWRIKLVFLLIVYFGGFATAIYTLAPAPSRCSMPDARYSTNIEKRVSSIEVNELAKSFNTGMHKCFEFGKEAALRTAKFIKQKIEERQARIDS